MTATRLILASGSSSRKAMMAAAGVEFEVIAPDIDEEALRAGLAPDARSDGRSIAEHLARCKALAVSACHPGALVIGSDQVLVCEGRVFTKAADDREAAATLKALRGRAHMLISSAAIAKERELIWRHTDTARLTMREFSDAFLEQYLRAELPDILGSVGCYRIEGRGAQLFERIEGDQFTIRGLPLIPLLDALRVQGVLAS